MSRTRVTIRLAGTVGVAALLFLLAVGLGCRSAREAPPLAFMFPTLYSPRILEDVTPTPTSAKNVESILRRFGLARDLRDAGMADRELEVIARGLSNRGYAELDARRADGRVRWVSFRGKTPNGQGKPVLVVTAGYWLRPGDLSRFGIDTRANQPVRSERRDPYGVPQTVDTWTGTGSASPVLRRVLDAFSGDLSHWELEVTVPADAPTAEHQP
jgi:DNA-binding protein H-NS